MIPAIGTIIGAYIVLRCVSLALRTGEKAEPTLVRYLAGLCAVLVVFLTYTLWESAAEYEKAARAATEASRHVR